MNKSNFGSNIFGSSRSAIAHAGDDEVHVYRAYRDALLRALRCMNRVFRSDASLDAEDLCQETFRVFFERCRSGGFDPSRAAAPYLYGIARKLACRRARTWREVPVDCIERLAVSEETWLERFNASCKLSSLLARLDDRERSVLVHYFDDYESQETVGKQLGLSRDQVQRSVARIREKARACHEK
jgi:RNA polymerase sigma factor (sigma-70 family)